MSKLKIEHGVSRIRRAKLQVSIDQSVAEDIQLMADWSNNESQYIVNQLLRFALSLEEEFQKYKATLATHPVKSGNSTKPMPSPSRTSGDAAPKADPSATARA